MERAGKILRKLLLPPVWLLVLCGIGGGVGLALVFGNPSSAARIRSRPEEL